MDLKIANFGNLPRGSFVGRMEVKYSIFVYVIMLFNIQSTAIVLKKCYLDINHWVNKIYIINKKSTLDYHLLSLKLTLITLHGWSIPLYLLFFISSHSLSWWGSESFISHPTKYSWYLLVLLYNWKRVTWVLAVLKLKQKFCNKTNKVFRYFQL